MVIDKGKIHKRKKKPSKQFREEFGHTPVSMEEAVPWNCRRLASLKGLDRRPTSGDNRGQRTGWGLNAIEAYLTLRVGNTANASGQFLE